MKPVGGDRWNWTDRNNERGQGQGTDFGGSVKSIKSCRNLILSATPVHRLGPPTSKSDSQAKVQGERWPMSIDARKAFLKVHISSLYASSALEDAYLTTISADTFSVDHMTICQKMALTSCRALNLNLKHSRSDWKENHTT